MRVLMVSMFFCFISVMPELAVSNVKRARAWTYASRSNWNKPTQNKNLEKSNMHILQNIYFSVPQKKAIEV